jgi:hypothetical protein
MATWTSIPNAAVAAGGRPRGSVVTALRDNPVAITEAAAGAPRIVFAAIVDGVAGASFGSVGTYVFASISEAGLTAGGTYVGSALVPSILYVDDEGGLSLQSRTGALTGTWRAMGGSNALSFNPLATLFLRIA